MYKVYQHYYTLLPLLLISGRQIGIDCSSQISVQCCLVLGLVSVLEYLYDSVMYLLMVRARAEEIVKFRRVVGSDWLEYIQRIKQLRVRAREMARARARVKCVICLRGTDRSTGMSVNSYAHSLVSPMECILIRRVTLNE